MRKRRSLRLAAFLFLFCTNPYILSKVAGYWEVKPTDANSISGTYEVGVVLGGFSDFDGPAIYDRYNFGNSPNRLTNAIELYHKRRIKKILITSGSGAYFAEKIDEAPEAKKFLINIGIPESDILIESNSRNTWENSFFTKELLQEKGIQSDILLITSASHMRRSLGCFHKAGFQNCDPYPTDFLNKRFQWTPDHTILPDSKGFFNWQILIKEWIGYLVYAIRGYI